MSRVDPEFVQLRDNCDAAHRLLRAAWPSGSSLTAEAQTALARARKAVEDANAAMQRLWCAIIDLMRAGRNALHANATMSSYPLR